MTSTDRCGPRLCENMTQTLVNWNRRDLQLIKHTLRYDLTLSHVLMFLTLFKRKCGSSDFLVRRDDVKCEKNFAYKNLK